MWMKCSTHQLSKSGWNAEIRFSNKSTYAHVRSRIKSYEIMQCSEIVEPHTSTAAVHKNIIIDIKDYHIYFQIHSSTWSAFSQNSLHSFGFLDLKCKKFKTEVMWKETNYGNGEVKKSTYIYNIQCTIRLCTIGAPRKNPKGPNGSWRTLSKNVVGYG